VSAPPTWADTAVALRDVTPGDLRTLWQVTRLPLLWARLLASLDGLGGAESVHRRLTRLGDAGLIAWVRSSTWPLIARTAGRRAGGRAPRLYYPTDLGLAVLALDSGLTPEAVARRHRLRRRDLLAAVAGLPQLAAVYTLLALVASSRPSPCTVTTWERPWRRRFRAPTVAALVTVALPAYAVLEWDGGPGAEGLFRAEILLLPDLAMTPLAPFRQVVGRLVDWREEREGWYRSLPGAGAESDPPAVLIIAATGEQRARAWRQVLDDACAFRREAPLAATVLTWSELRAGAADLDALLSGRAVGAPEPVGSDPHSRPVSGRERWSPSRGAPPLRPVPQLIGPTLAPPPAAHADTGSRRQRADLPLPEAAGAAAVGLMDTDRVFLDLAGRHAFLPSACLPALFGWSRAAAFRSRGRLISRGLLRLAGPEDVPGPVALQEPVELTAAGVVVVTAQLGLPVGQAARYVGLAGGGPGELAVGAAPCTVGARHAQSQRWLAPARRARRRLLRHVEHTLGADAVFVELAATARALAATGVDAGLEEWRGPAACTRGPVRPDGYAILRLRGRRFGFFLEYDRGTERPAHHLAKLDAYYAYRDTERYARDYDGFPTILVVASDTDAEQRIAAVAASSAVGRSVPLPLLLTCEWRYRGDGLRIAHPDGLLGPVWRAPESPRRRRWPGP
jgi:hypothetical protein